MHRSLKLLLVIGFLFLSVFPEQVMAQSRRLERAERAFELRQYNEAVDLYRRAYNRVSRRDREEATRLTFKIAMCYRYTHNHRMAEAWFNRAVRFNYPDPVAILYLADAMMMNEKYEDALQQYKRYAEKVPDDWRGHHGIASVELAVQLLEAPEDYEVESVRLFNSRADDYTPAFADHRASSLIFASSRDAALGDDNDPWTGNKHTSFFITYQNRAGNWDRPSILDEGPVNTEYNEGAPSINAAATEMYFTRCTRAEETDMGCRIFRSRREGANWGTPQEIRLTTDSAVTVGHPAISPDELALYFVSNMRGSIGENDIWVVRRNTRNDEFGPPEHLGDVINTRGNEMFPYVHEDGSLYFASDGHPGMGGLDIFRSTNTIDGWTKPENIGPPINSSADDFGIVFKPGLEQGFFSSNRGRIGSYNIFSFYRAPVEFMISGQVLDDSTRAVVRGAAVQLVGSDGSLRQTETDREGKYVFGSSEVKENTEYEILVNKAGYFAARSHASTVGEERSRQFEVNMTIAPIPLTAIGLPEIFFEFDSWELQTQFKDSLNGLIRLMQDNPNIVIELAAHTDDRGTEEYNDSLSQRRAREVVNYLVEQGIDPGRLQPVSYGKRMPRIIEATIEREGFVFEAGTELTEEYISELPTEEHQEAAHQLNRRTEFRVVAEDYEPPDPPDQRQRTTPSDP